MKKILTALAAVALLASCSKSGQDQTGDETMRVAFSVKSPASGKVTYKSDTPEAVTGESEVATLYIYLFEPTVATPTTTDHYALKKIVPVTGTITAEGDIQNVTSVTVQQRNKKHFYFVANLDAGFDEDDYGTLTETELLEALMTEVTTASNVSISGGMPMTAYKEVDFSSGAPSSSIEVKLVRAVARIDILNEVDDFSVESIQIINTRSKSYLFAGQTTTPGSKITAKVVSIPAEADQTERLAAVCYLYESPAADAVKVSIKGSYGDGREKLIEVPFVLEGAAVPIQRNYVYTLRITTGQRDIIIPIDPGDWGDGGGIDVEP